MTALALQSDASALAAVHQRAFDHPWDVAALSGLLAAPGVFALSAQRHSAFILVRVAADEAEILTLAVLPEARRLGLGRLLVRAAVKHVAARNATDLFLEVRADNDAALALYRQEGFTMVGRRAAYYTTSNGGPVDALLLKKPVRPAA